MASGSGSDGKIVIDTEIDDSGVDKGLEDTRKKLDSMDKAANDFGKSMKEVLSQAVSYDSISRSVDRMVDQLQRLQTQAEQGFSSAAQAYRWGDSMDALERKADRLQEKLEQIGKTKIYTDEYQWYAQELKKAEAEAERLSERLVKMDDTGVKKNSAAYKNLQYDIETTTRKVADYKNEMAQMEAAGTAFTLGQNTGEYKQTEESLKEVEAELERVRAAGEQAAASLGGSFGEDHPILEALSADAKKVASAFLSMGKAIGKAALGAALASIKKLGNKLKSVASGAKKAMTSLLGFNKTASAGVSPINSLIKGLTSFKTMLLSRLKRSIIDDIYTSIEEGIQGFAKYSSAFNTSMSNIKNSCSQIGAQIAVLFANIITVIEPILTRILSLVNSVVTAVSALFAKLTGKNTVAVAAKSTASYADSLDNASSSAKKAASEQKKFNAELYSWDELTKQSSTDDSDDSSSGSSSGPSWTEVPVDDILKDWEDIDWFQMGYDWAEKIANALDSIPWDTIQAAAYTLGQHFAELLNGVFANLHLANSLGTTIAEALNTGLCFALGFLEMFDFSQFGVWMGTLWNAFVNAFDFDKLAQVITLGGNGIIDAFTSFFQTIAQTCETLGAGIATVFNAIFVGIDFSAAANAVLLGVHDVNMALYGFTKKIEWGDIAKNIRNGVNTLIRGMEIDENGQMTNVWAENGREVGRLIGGFWDTAYDIVTSLDYVTLGANLALWLENAIAEINPETVGGTLGGILRGIVDTAYSFVDNLSTEELAAKLKTAAQSLIDKMNEIDPSTGLNGWQKLGSTIAGIGNGIVEAFESIPWGDVASGVAQAISTGLSEADIELKIALGVVAIAKIAGVVINSAVGQLIGKALAEKIVSNLATSFPSMGSSITGALSSLGSAIKAFATTDVLAAGAGQIGAAILAGLFIGGEIGKMIDNYLIGPILENFDGQELSAELYKNFHFFGEGGFFDQMWDDNESFLGNVQTWGSALGMMFSDLGSSLSSLWSTCWGGIRDFGSSVVDSIKTTVSEGWNNLKTNTLAAWTGIKSSITESWTNIKTTASEAAENVKTKVTTAWTNLKTNTATTYSNIKSTIQTKFNEAKTSVSTAVSNMKSSATSGWTNMVSTAKSKFSDIYNTCKSKMSSVTSHLKSIQWGSIGTNLVNGLLNGLKSAWANVTSWISSATSALTSKVKSILGIASPSKEWAKIGVFLDEGLTQGLQSGATEMLNSASALASSLTDRMTDVEGTVEMTDDSDITRLGIIEDKLAGIAAIMDNIVQAITDMGGLQIPQIATGTVVPYSTRAAAEAGSSNTSEDSYTGEMVQLLRNIRDYLAAGGGGNSDSDIKVIIDGREVFNAVVNENNRVLRSTGGVSPLKV